MIRATLFQEISSFILGSSIISLVKYAALRKASRNVRMGVVTLQLIAFATTYARLGRYAKSDKRRAKLSSADGRKQRSSSFVDATLKPTPNPFVNKTWILSPLQRLKLAFKPYHTIQQIDAICDRLCVDDFLLMAYNPGIKVQNAFFDLDQLNHTERFVTVDGGVTPQTLSKFQLHPRIRLVAGSKIIFNDKYKENMQWLTS